jgi:exopolyphosphatase/guanosine-5'-triphosphate,3'-diphosphate pyrophosphatase
VRIAVVDVGTNTTRLYVAEVEDGRITAELGRESQVTRLGAGVDASGKLADDALEREYTVLDRYYNLMYHEYDAKKAVAVMTSAVRDAANGQEFADEVADHFGFEVHVISGDEEAHLTYLGATDELAADPDGEATLVFDIGGGSTELVIGHGKNVDFHVSTQAGVVRQADRHIESDPPTGEELEAVAQDVRGVLERAVPAQLRSHPGRALGVPAHRPRWRRSRRTSSPTTQRKSTATCSAPRGVMRSSSGSWRCRSQSASRSRGFTPTARSRSCRGS